jgi:DMSO/TMAO reductase YedYZ molybdopterin-dependent catalytic subunit
VVEPALRPGAEITHASFHGLDGFRAVLLLKDALADDVLLADRLDGRPLDGDHGAPLRLMSPGQYGFMSAKHLCRIELHTTAPDAGYGAPFRWMELALRHLITTHPRARVWEEERHRHLPGAVVRPVYGLLIPAIRRLSARGRRR